MEPERKYVTLDDQNARRLAENDAALFFETYGTPLLIDEFQHVPSILLEIKRIVDEKMLNGTDCNKNFSVLEKLKLEIQPGIILCMTDEMIPYNREVWYYPVSAI